MSPGTAGSRKSESRSFAKRLLLPVLKSIEERGLTDQIDYVVYSSDFPYSIDAKADAQGQKLPKQLQPLGSINSLTYLWQLVLLKPEPGGPAQQPIHAGGQGPHRGRPGARFSLLVWLGAGGRTARGRRRALHALDHAGGDQRPRQFSARSDRLLAPQRQIRRNLSGRHDLLHEDRRRPFHHPGGALRRALAGLEKLGVKAIAEHGILPTGRSDVQGLMAGASDFDWRSSGSTIRPGAICEHLTSTGGMLTERAGQTPLTEFLRFGAAASSGAVTKPYAIQDKFPVPALHIYYAQGCSLAEAYYQSVFGPYQLLIVGDPLCRPWANIRKCKPAASSRMPGSEAASRSRRNRSLPPANIPAATTPAGSTAMNCSSTAGGCCVPMAPCRCRSIPRPWAMDITRSALWESKPGR